MTYTDHAKNEVCISGAQNTPGPPPPIPYEAEIINSLDRVARDANVICAPDPLMDPSRSP